MPRTSIIARLEDILRAIRTIDAGTRGATADRILQDEFDRFGIERGIEIISEASRHVPDQYKRQHPGIPWRSIRTIGNVLRHEYNRVEPAII